MNPTKNREKMIEVSTSPSPPPLPLSLPSHASSLPLCAGNVRGVPVCRSVYCYSGCPDTLCPRYVLLLLSCSTPLITAPSDCLVLEGVTNERESRGQGGRHCPHTAMGPVHLPSPTPVVCVCALEWEAVYIPGFLDVTDHIRPL